WTQFELKNYLTRHRCLIASAESAMLRALCSDSQYRALAREHLPENSKLFFHQIREDGRRYSETLYLIRQDLIHDIQKLGVDSLILSLGSGAKIHCSDLAPQLGIRAVDFGCMPRALTYSGSPGYNTHRDYHNPFLFRVPFPGFMNAFE